MQKQVNIEVIHQKNIYFEVQPKAAPFLQKEQHEVIHQKKTRQHYH